MGQDVCLTREAYWSDGQAVMGVRKPCPIREAPEAGGTRGWQIHGSTEEAGPEKPGKSAEEKTLKTREAPNRKRFWTENPPLDDGQHTSEPATGNGWRPSLAGP